MKANRKRILVLAAAAAAVAAVGVTMAFMFRKADAENRRLSPVRYTSS